MTTGGPLAPARLCPRDLARLASVGIRTRKLRAALSALGIAIGVAAIVAVLGLSASSEAGLLSEINKLGTNLLTVTNGQTLFGQTAELPVAAPGTIGRIGPVTDVQYVETLNNVNAYRSPLIPSIGTDALSVDASSTGLPADVCTTVDQGTYLNAATLNEPVCVLGARPPNCRGSTGSLPARGFVGGRDVVLRGGDPGPGFADLRPVLVGFPAAEKYLGSDGHPSEIYLRTQTGSSEANGVYNVLAATANPEAPNQVDVERRSEIGLRRALGATKGHVRVQFKAEAVLFSLLGVWSVWRPERFRPPSTLRPRVGRSIGPRSPGPAVRHARALRRLPSGRPRRTPQSGGADGGADGRVALAVVDRPLVLELDQALDEGYVGHQAVVFLVGCRAQPRFGHLG